MSPALRFVGFSGEEICKRKAFGSLFGVERESGLDFLVSCLRGCSVRVRNREWKRVMCERLRVARVGFCVMVC